MGDPRGIGPEVIAKALSDDELRRSTRWVVYGWSSTIRDAFAHLGRTTPPELQIVEAVPPDSEPGGASFAFVEQAISAGAAGRAAAIVTAPINKEAWASAGHANYPGHTELLIERLAAGSPSDCNMMFVAPMLRVILVTAHIPLARVPQALTIERVAGTIRAAHRACVELGVLRPRIATCGVNPHAGENNLLGDDETRVIIPAIHRAKSDGIDAQGPFPADTVFRDAVNFRKFDIVVAMYHDQGLIPVKTLAFDSAVNMTTGLRIPRTSPDHGTAFDIAGKNLADHGSMKHAMQLAVTLASRRKIASPHRGHDVTGNGDR
ncbi:MAG: 4-hydroxythreonine-4-phosphate dehydrogenase PdxA [Phycisphaeraceae bacterium]|nr:4-hydroxythreonine-4-phosphate dehydrogenase PdxA [Phycisphaeraceae bacterium]